MTDGRTDRNYFEKTGVALLRTTSFSKLKLSDEAWIAQEIGGTLQAMLIYALMMSYTSVARSVMAESAGNPL